MRILTDDRARAMLSHPHINVTKVALSYYDVDVGNMPEGKTPTNYSNALRKVTLLRPPGKIRPNVLKRLTMVLAPLWGLMAEPEQQIL